MEEKWIELLKIKYKSIESPDYSFVLDEVEKKPYRNLIAELRRRFSIEEDTDENYDVSFGYILSTEYAAEFVVRISMVAPVAYFSRINGDGSTSRPILKKSTKNAIELEVIGAIESHGIQLLDAKILSAVVPVVEKKEKSFYQWLFVNESDVPWGAANI